MKLSSGPLAAALLSTGSHALFGNREPPKPQPHIIDSFTWADPFITPEITSYDAECEHTAVLPAREYTLNELQVPSPKGLREWAPGLKTFFSGREYPGSWGGLDRHLHDRTILSMEYKDLPLEVRLWIEEQERSDGEGKGLFGVFVKPTEVDEEGELVPITEVVSFPKPEEVDRSQDEHKVAIFAPGAIYHALPLFAAESSTCKDIFSDMSRYQIQPADGKVVGWVEHKKPKETEMAFRVKVRALKAKPAEADKKKDEEPVVEKTDEAGAKETATRDEL